MIECIICYDPLTDPYAAACDGSPSTRHNNAYANALPVIQRSISGYSSDSRLMVVGSEALVEELSALRTQVKDLDACNASLKTEVEGLRSEVEGYKSLTEELLADMYTEDENRQQERNRVACALHGVFTSIRTVFLRKTVLLGVLSALWNALVSVGCALFLQTVWLGIEIVWRVVTRPEECLREVAFYVWLFTDVAASAMILALALLGILCGDYECIVIWLDFGYPRLCGLLECIGRKSNACLVRRFSEE
ncbi:uncharacterized protein EV420DRAFT_1474298 [Desarmillaria tabescens]|uniref:Uncharacterized protein n=1 Tax=Armillaria tabescens TaxID=1929756 RepID=A0AA39TQD9_ARMTA|nr:uncharacterized protein EV420DRAFT_1474298 [Desarmillaria tabescens]KAK0466872.1 hypothetical protein EV420DRAFT_1474298 [Desarmillaria tabescens]